MKFDLVYFIIDIKSQAYYLFSEQISLGELTEKVSDLSITERKNIDRLNNEA